jgi:hypothetical protein
MDATRRRHIPIILSEPYHPAVTGPGKVHEIGTVRIGVVAIPHMVVGLYLSHLSDEIPAVLIPLYHSLWVGLQGLPNFYKWKKTV